MTELGRLLIVVVNYRTADLVIDCLASLAGEVGGAAGAWTVEVVDNASGDGSAGRISGAIRANSWGSWAAVRPLERNGGFAAGNNAALVPALHSADPPHYILLLNPDTVARGGAVAALVRFMDGHPEVGIAGSRLENPDGTSQWTACRFPTVVGELEDGLRLGLVTRLLGRWAVSSPPPDRAGPTEWVSGASMIVRREVFDAIGPLDDGYFLYFEEVDFCLRALRAGWPCWYVPESRVVHLIGQSTGMDDPTARRRKRPEYWFRARRRFFLKNYGPARTALADLAWASAFASYRVRRVLQRKPDRDPEGMLRDFIRHNFILPLGGR